MTTTAMSTEQFTDEAERARTDVLNTMSPKVVQMATEQKWTLELRKLVLEYMSSLASVSGKLTRPEEFKNEFVYRQINKLFKATCHELRIEHELLAGQSASWYMRRRPRHKGRR